MQRILHLAFLYGRLEQRNGRAYVPGAMGKPVCREEIVQSLINRGWLKQEGHSSFAITDQGRQAEDEFNEPQ